MNTGGYTVQLPTLSKINKWLAIISATLFLLNSFLEKLNLFSLNRLLGLSASDVYSGLVYQIVTYPLIHTNLIQLIFSLLIFWFIGSEIEKNWGSRGYFYSLLITTVGAAISHLVLVSLFFQDGPAYYFPLTGLGNITSALCLVYAVIYPNRTFLFMFIFPIKSKYFCLILVVMQLYMGLMGDSTVSMVVAWSHLSAMLVIFAYLMFLSPALRGLVFNFVKVKNNRPNHLKLVKDKPKDKNLWH